VIIIGSPPAHPYAVRCAPDAAPHVATPLAAMLRRRFTAHGARCAVAWPVAVLRVHCVQHLDFDVLRAIKRKPNSTPN
jgi:hypothetical protein